MNNNTYDINEFPLEPEEDTHYELLRESWLQRSEIKDLQEFILSTYGIINKER